jgi:diaminopimelate epimerase
MKFTKMHGCGNDYVYVNCFKEKVDNPGEVAKFISRRHFGIGSDGLILIKPSQKADFAMEMYNADGSEGKMCGNGVRCIAKYVYDNGMIDKKTIVLETKGGIKYLDVAVRDKEVTSVRVNMGEPILSPALIPVISKKDRIIGEDITIDNTLYKMTCVSMGNPHGVVFVAATNTIEIEKIGPQFEHHPMFPDGINTEFVQIIDENTINMRVWERGSGETLACGTGACASVYACILNGLTKDRVKVHLLGGDLDIEYKKEENVIFMTGPATKVFDGEIDYEGKEV